MVAVGTWQTYSDVDTKVDQEASAVAALYRDVNLELKIEVYRRVDTNFPHKANLERRARYVWSSLLDWAIEFPDKRKVSAQLNVSDLITPETRFGPAGCRMVSRNGLGY